MQGRKHTLCSGLWKPNARKIGWKQIFSIQLALGVIAKVRQKEVFPLLPGYKWNPKCMCKHRTWKKFSRTSIFQEQGVIPKGVKCCKSTVMETGHLGMKMPPPCLLGLYRSKQDKSPLVMQHLSFQRYVVSLWCFTNEFEREASQQQTKNWNSVTHQNLREQKCRCTSRGEMGEERIFGLMANHERKMKGRMDKIREEKQNTYGRSNPSICSFPPNTAVTAHL